MHHCWLCHHQSGVGDRRINWLTCSNPTASFLGGGTCPTLSKRGWMAPVTLLQRRSLWPLGARVPPWKRLQQGGECPAGGSHALSLIGAKGGLLSNTRKSHPNTLSSSWGATASSCSLEDAHGNVPFSWSFPALAIGFSLKKCHSSFLSLLHPW